MKKNYLKFNTQTRQFAKNLLLTNSHTLFF